MLSVLTQFLSDQSRHVMVDGCHSKLINVVSGVPQGSVLGPPLFFLHTAELFSIVENNELCMLFRIRSNPMNPLSGALPMPYVPACVTHGALVPHRHSFAPPRCWTSQYRITFLLSRSLFGTILVTLCLMV